MLTLNTFAECVGCTMMTASNWFVHFEKAMLEFQISPGIETAAYLAQIGHESTSLSRLEENLNYSAERMMQVWKSRFPTIESAKPYEHRPEKLANLVYASRNGNGIIASGDGWKYRGRGPKQITFADNYRACGKALNMALIEKPDLLLQVSPGSRSAAWFWYSRKCKDTCADPIATTRKINGGENGLSDRVRRFEHAKKILGVN